MKRVLIAVAVLALACAGFATAAVATKTIRLHGGQSVKVGNAKVMCLAKTIKLPGKTYTITDTQTVTAPTKTVTVTVTTGGSTPPPPTTTTTNSTPVVKDFAGNGDQYLDPFTTTVGEHLYWTWQNTNGDYPTGMFISDTDSIPVNGDGNTTSGSTYLAPGTHSLHVITVGNWTIHIGP
jgi:hypothetical protein